MVRTSLIPDMSITMAPGNGSTPPYPDVDMPRGTTGTPSRTASFTSATTSSSVLGLTTAPATPVGMSGLTSFGRAPMSDE